MPFDAAPDGCTVAVLLDWFWEGTVSFHRMASCRAEPGKMGARDDVILPLIGRGGSVSIREQMMSCSLGHDFDFRLRVHTLQHFLPRFKKIVSIDT